VEFYISFILDYSIGKTQVPHKVDNTFYKEETLIIL